MILWFYSFYLGPVCPIGFVLVWLFWLGAEADVKYGSLLSVVPKIPEGGYLRESIKTEQAFKKCHKPSKSQQKPTTQKLPQKTEFSTTEWSLFIYLISLCFTNPCKLLSSTASSGKGFQGLYSQWHCTSFYFEPASCQLQLMTPILFFLKDSDFPIHLTQC